MVKISTFQKRASNNLQQWNAGIKYSGNGMWRWIEVLREPMSRDAISLARVYVKADGKDKEFKMVRDINRTLRMIRMIFLGTTMVFAAVVLGFGVAITDWTSWVINGFSRNYAPYAVVAAIAIAALTLITVPIMFFSTTRRRAFPNMNPFEIAWTGVLWILWLATGVFTTNLSTSQTLYYNCRFVTARNVVDNCQKKRKMTVFEFFTCALLLCYNLFLLILIIRQQKCGTLGERINFAAETDFGAQGTPAGAFSSQPQVEQNVSPSIAPQYPPLPQQQQRLFPPHPMDAEPKL
ncbi:hypothetical protein CPC08DRAFT_793737 [Agrocybe pediades]|nr:hypothetical protein CPC08DRAFT_793737 [Agrocybe pediades]